MMVPIDHDPKKNPIVHCKLCGSDERCVWNQETNAKLVKTNTCFTCNYWEEAGERLAASVGKKFPDAVVTNNPEDGGPMIYFVLSEMPQRSGFMRGYGGAKHIVEFDDGRKMASSNLWSGQKIPTLWTNDSRFKPTSRLRGPHPIKDPNFQEDFDALIKAGSYFQNDEQEE